MDALATLESRRFGGITRLFGPEGAARLRAAHVVVVGIGGVGSWAAEALARSGIGTLTLIDLDHVAESNLNRQVHALESTIGMAKVDAMRARILEIAPGCDLRTVDDFVTTENVASLIPADADFVIDAIDQMKPKAALIAHCRAAGIPVVACGAAGGRTDPLRLRQEDLARTAGDALLASVRARLRRAHGFPAPPAKTRDAARAERFGVTAIFSDEQPARPDACDLRGGAALNCAGYGSAVTVTAPMGMAAAGFVMRMIAAGRARPKAPPARAA